MSISHSNRNKKDQKPPKIENSRDLQQESKRKLTQKLSKEGSKAIRQTRKN